MPIYRCLVQQNRFNAEQKSKLACEITRIHAEVTGAPEIFVDVIFDEAAQGDWFTGGELSSRSIIQAHIRAGRTVEQKTRLLSSISRSWKLVTGQPEQDLEITLTDFEAKNIMRGGMLLPEAGEEHQWLEQLEAATSGAIE
jgi:phenylpyruvate tautomerase PptA (4-oxalocrotonate tautomerase family)